MYGAIIGDISGSFHEFEKPPLKDKNYQFFTEESSFTDDTVMTCAVAFALMNSIHREDIPQNVIDSMQMFGKLYAGAGYGAMFGQWIFESDPKPYNSFGNGSAMRVSPVGWIAKTEDDIKELSRLVTEVTHNHPEGIKGAEAVAMCIFLARNGKSKSEIEEYVIDNYYTLDFTLDEIRPYYRFDVTCQGSIPQAIKAFLESENYEDAVRNAVSLGGDTDTQGAITGSIAEAYYGIPQKLIDEADKKLDSVIRAIVERFRKFVEKNE